MTILTVPDAERPRTAAEFSTIFVLTPAVVGRCPFVVACNADERRQVRCIACQQQSTAVLVERAQLILGSQCLHCVGSECIVSVDTAILVVVPPEDLALREVDLLRLDVGKRSIHRLGNVSQHPCACSSCLGIQLRHIGCCTYEDCFRTTDGNDGHHIFALGSIVGDGVGDGL